MKAAFATACVALSIAALGSSAARAVEPSADLIKQAAATNGGQILVEWSLSDDTIPAYVDTFNKIYGKQGLHVKLLRYQTNQMIETYEQELRAGKVGTDVLFVGDPAVLIELGRKNELTPYCSANFKDFRPEALSPTCVYFDATVHFQYMVYNTDEISAADAPTSWLDLVNPKWKGKVSILDPRSGGGTDYFVYTMYKLFGADFFAKARANGDILDQSVNTTENQVMSGERAISVSISDLVRQDGNYPGGKDAPIKEVFPKEGAALIAAGMGITTGGPNPAGAKVFEDWTASLDGQKALSQHGLFSLRKDFTDVTGDDLSKISYHWWDPAEMAKDRQSWIDAAANAALGKQ